LVEHRVNRKAFLQSLKPNEISKFILTYEGLKKILEKYVSKSLSNFLANALIFLQGSNLASEALQTYFEYDWKTFGENYEDALYYLAQKEAKNESITLNDVIKIVGMLWPDPWPSLTETNLKEKMPEASIIYYEGLGNGSLWILPNNFEENRDILSYSFWIQQFTNYQYNGSKLFLPEDIPLIRARIVWDNSDFAALGKMKDSFLRNGATSFIGASALNYAPFSGEIDSRFFSNENTVGKALIYALNTFRSDFLTWDPFDITKPGIKKKSLLEFFLFGDPSIPKEGRVELEYHKLLFDCKENCELKVFIPFNFTFKDGKLHFDSKENLVEEDEPIIPIERFVYYLPENVSISEDNITVSFDEEKIENITLPKVKILSHSNSSFETNKTGTKLTKKHKIRINETIDGRKEVEVIVPSIIYNETESSAMIIKNVTISLTYSSPLDFEISAKDIRLGEEAEIKLKIFSKVFDNATIYLEISNSTNAFNFEFNESLENVKKEINYKFKPEAPGIYRVRAILKKWDPLIIGPREATFIVSENETNENVCNEQKILINEIMYDPKGKDEDREWIEIFNIGSCDVNLTGWKFFESNTNHRIVLIDGNIILKPKSFAIISNNASKFKEEYPSAYCSIFQSSFSLSNQGEFIAIKNSSLEIIDSVNYSRDWGASDNGKSLELKDGKWVESYADGGTPCLPNDDKPSESQASSKVTSYFSLIGITKNETVNKTENKIENITNVTVAFPKNITSNASNETKETIIQQNKTKEIKRIEKNLPTGFFVLSNFSLVLILLSLLVLFLISFFVLKKKILTKRITRKIGRKS
jgi:hypothetical protein